LFGAAFFGLIAGTGVVDPREVRWVFQGDWQWHFLGWQFFRSEPWHVPPGQLTRYIEPLGSAIGYTDSIPLVALLLRPFAALLPNPMQYLGVWLLACFVLQGLFGSLLISAWTKDTIIRTFGGCLFVLAPTLLARYIHPALCSHWVLLWALWLAFREPPLLRVRAFRYQFAVALVSGLLHPYLAVMTLLVLFAVATTRVVVVGRPAILETTGLAVTALAGLVIGWWASGLLTLTSSRELQTEGLGLFSMNLLALINPGPGPRARFVPELPWISPAQYHEGFHYLGLGVLFLCVGALIAVLTTPRRFRLSFLPITVVLFGLALFSLSPRITFGDRVVVDWLPYFGESSTFRASARFFWPVTYALLAATVGTVATTFRRSVAVALLAAALALQFSDLQPWYRSLYYGFRNPVFLGANLPIPSAEWDELLGRFDHLRMYSPQYCGGPVPVAMPFAGYLAGVNGLAFNDGFAARMDADAMSAECQRLKRDFDSGVVREDTVYLVASSLLAEFQKRASVRCRAVDGVPVCVSVAVAEQRSLRW
jgi:hypothetical protein